MLKRRENHSRQSRLLLLFVMFFLWGGVISAQSNPDEGRTITYRCTNQSLHKALSEVERLSGYYRIQYVMADVEPYTVTADIQAQPVTEAVAALLKSTPLKYDVNGRFVQVYNPAKRERQSGEKGVATGRVVDEQGEPLIGVSVREAHGKNGTVTDMDGRFSLRMTHGSGRLVFSYIGMKTQTADYKGEGVLDVTLSEDSERIDEVVVNGYYTKNKSSFTGNAVSVSRDELMKVSHSNLMTALQVFDPSFKLQEDISAGSNPNAVPSMRIRGDSGFGEISETNLKNDPNLPTFILDGYEVTAEKVYDLNMDRVESVTILKDASATAIYGSRAANGVIVITTKAPEPGRLRVSYQFDGVVQTPDLRDYNLMNAAEKLEAERLAGYYENPGDPFTQQASDKDYALRLSNVRRGVDTYWLSQPIQTIVGQKHSLYLEGGDESIRYGVSANYQNNPGVMKESFRNRYGLEVNLQYNWKNKLLFRNMLSVNRVKSQESPYGSFTEYAQTNPYWPVRDENGELIKQYEQNIVTTYVLRNPLGEALLNNRDESEYLEVTNNFNFEWYITQHWRFKGQLSYTMRRDHAYSFVDPNSVRYNYSDYQEGDGVLKKGEAYNYDESSHTLDANALMTYSQNFGSHYLNAALGVNMTETKYSNVGFGVIGFPSSNMDYVSFGKEFQNSSPDGEEGLSRLFGSFLNFNYTYNNIYLFDLSGRMDGSSSFGKDSHFAPFWSVGIGWNVHNEKWFTRKDIVNHLKLTMNVGETGKASFSPYEAQNMFTYYKGKYYAGGVGAIITTFGNEDLQWEKTRSWDINLETEFLNGAISAKFSYYNKLTNDLVSNVTLPQSSGFTYYRANIGKMENSGYEVNLRVFPVRTQDLHVSLFGTLAHNRNVIKEISNALKARNEQIDKEQDDYEADYGERYETAKPQVEFKEGESTTTIYAVRSLGINPANGKEVYLDRYGNPTYTWSSADKVACGDTSPTVQGSFGANADWKGFNLNMSFLYECGGQLYNQTLVDRVENANVAYNVDRRFLYDRWQEPGDIARFKDIRDDSRTELTSRMIQDNNVLQFKSLSLSYTFPQDWTRRWAIDRLKLTFLVEDLFYWSTVKRERGTDYPYSHSFNFGLQVQF